MQVDYKRTISCCILLGFLFITASARGQDISLRDDFGSETLASIWNTDRLAKNALKHVISPNRTGSGAVEITLYPHAKAATGRDGNLTERAELTEETAVRLCMGMEVWYAFSFLLPSDFPIVDTRLVLAQWLQECKDCTKKHSPMVSLRYYGGILRVYVMSDRGKRRPYKQELDLRNKWVDMIFRIVPKTNKKGSLQVWMDSNQIASYRGALGHKDDKDRFFFKMGLYRDHMQQPMRIILDRFRRGRSYSEVSISE